MQAPADLGNGVMRAPSPANTSRDYHVIHANCEEPSAGSTLGKLSRVPLRAEVRVLEARRILQTEAERAVQGDVSHPYKGDGKNGEAIGSDGVSGQGERP